jgi:fibronectin type 3 domain-containing protein
MRKKLLASVLTGFVFCTVSAWAQTNACDLNSDGVVNATDVQLAISMTLGTAQCNAHVAGVNVCNAEIVQRVINASLGNACLTSTGMHIVSLTWTASSSSGVTGYQISRGTSASGPFAVLTTIGNITSFNDTTVVSGTTYYYVIASVAGSSVGVNSSPIQAAVPTP